MSGHSHWATIRRKKAGVDAKKGVAFSKAAKAITIAARHGGGDPNMNLALRYALLKAREVNMPRDNIERAVKKGTGEGGEVHIEQLLYEVYAPGGVALLIDIVTDSRNRTSAEIRNIIEKHGGTIAATNAVARLFQRKGIITIPAEAAHEDKVMEIALEAGADDVTTADNIHQVSCKPEAFETVAKAFEAAAIKVASANVEPVPLITVPVDFEHGKKVMKLIGLLEEQEDVSEVYSNLDISDEVMAQIDAAL
jgi:YebC/PmpR family DNA-binding regulatory protein